MTRTIILCCLAVLLFGCGDSEPTKRKTIAEQYPGSWNSDFRLDIARTLSNHDARGCGEFVYKRYHRFSPEAPDYLVYCTADGRNWTGYIVWPAINKITGPAKPDPSVPLPR